MNFWLLVLITCVSMVFKDAVGIFMTIAEARGNARVAALLNPLGTIAAVAFLSFGAVELLQRYHWHGVIGLIPVLVIDTVDGYFFTKWGQRMKSDPIRHPTHRRKV